MTCCRVLVMSNIRTTIPRRSLATDSDTVVIYVHARKHLADMLGCLGQCAICSEHIAHCAGGTLELPWDFRFVHPLPVLWGGGVQTRCLQSCSGCIPDNPCMCSYRRRFEGLKVRHIFRLQRVFVAILVFRILTMDFWPCKESGFTTKVFHVYI